MAHTRIPHQQAPKAENGTLFLYGFTVVANLPARVPKHAQAEVKAAFWAMAIFDDSDAEPGEAAVAHARQRAHAFADRYDRRYPPRSPSCWRPCPSSPPFLRFRGSTGPRIRHTNLVGRTFGETRRRSR